MTVRSRDQTLITHQERIMDKIFNLTFQARSALERVLAGSRQAKQFQRRRFPAWIGVHSAANHWRARTFSPILCAPFKHFPFQSTRRRL
jgi:hypothetical protein